MTELVIDTHAFIWIMNNDKTINNKIHGDIQKICSSGFLLVSCVSIWEIAMLKSKKRVTFEQPLHQWIERATAFPFVKIVDLSTAIILEGFQLPGNFHADPFDRMIVATARVLGIPLLTRDQKILDYAEEFHIKAIKC